MDLMSIPIIGSIVAGWNFLKGMFSKLYSVVFVHASLGWYPKIAMYSYLKTHLTMLSFHKHEISCEPYYVRTRNQTEMIPWKDIPGEAVIFRKGWRWIVYSGGTITFIRGMFGLDELISAAFRELNDKLRDGTDALNQSHRYLVSRHFGSLGGFNLAALKPHTPSNGEDKAEAPGTTPPDGVAALTLQKMYSTPIGYQLDEIGPPIPKGPLEHMVLTPTVRDFVATIRRWLKSKDWFATHNLPWKRGVLLYGPPGTGKTALVRAMACEFNMPVHVFDLPSMTNRDFSRAWDEAMASTPCFMLFEDIDTVFRGRKNVATTGKNDTGLTFSSFLNTIDGVDNTNGAFVVITTNDITCIDDAIAGVSESGVSTRPGRIDAILEMPLLGRDAQVELGYKLFDGYDASIWCDLVSDAPMTPAQFQELCCIRAIKVFGDGAPE